MKVFHFDEIVGAFNTVMRVLIPKITGTIIYWILSGAWVQGLQGQDAMSCAQPTRGNSFLPDHTANDRNTSRHPNICCAAF